MLVPAIFLFATFAQGPVSLEVGKPVEGTIGANADKVHTPTLDENYKGAPTVGNEFQVVVPMSGDYTLELRSFDFDAYLVVFDSDGNLLAEDDDGLLRTHARATIKLEAGIKYVVQACALHGKRGKFFLEVAAGTPAPLSQQDQSLAEEGDLKARLRHVESTKGSDSIEYAEAQDLLGLHYYLLGDYSRAMAEAENCLVIREKIYGPEHPEVARNLFNLAAILLSQDNYRDARPLLERSLAIREKVLGPEHLETAASLSRLAYVLDQQGKYGEARTLYERTLAIMEKVHGPDHPNTADALISLGNTLHNLSNFQEARHIYERALTIRQSVLGLDHPDTAQSLNNLANLLQAQGNYDEALFLYERSLGINEKVYGPEHSETASSLNNLALLHHSLGSFNAAHSLYERTLAIWEKLIGPDHPHVAISLNNLGQLLSDQGRYEEARLHFERSLVINEKVLGPEHPDTALILSNLAGVLNSQGDNEGARSLYMRALAINEKVLGPEHQRTAIGMNNLALVLQSQGNYDEARSLNERSLAIWEKVLGPEHPETAAALVSLASLIQSQGNYGEARPLFERSLRIWKNMLGLEHPLTATGLSHLALLLYAQGKYEEARPIFERVLSIREKVLGPDHPDTAIALNNCASILRELGQHGEALPLFQKLLSGSLSYLDRELPSMSEAGRLRLLEISARPEGLLEIQSHEAEAELKRTYSLFQNWKGKATRLQAASLRLSQRGQSSGIRKKKGQIQVISKKLSGLILLPIANQENDHATEIELLRQQRLRLEREVNRELGLDSILSTPSLSDVQQGMPPESVLIDFYVGSNVYAWVQHSSGEPMLISLGSASVLRSAQNAFLSATAVRGGRKLSSSETNPAAEYAALLWQPLREVVGESKTIFVSPDGFLCELPFGIMQEADESYLLEKHRFVYLSDPTVLAQASDSIKADEGSLIAVGGVNYFRRDEVGDSVSSGPTTRSRMGDSWSSLPATRDEIQSLRDLHDFILEWKSPMTVVEGKAATEERIRAELPGKRYVHIATHGYFEPEHLPSLLLDAEEKQSKAQLGEQIQAVGLLPGLLSGLVFAGVNGEPDPTRDDGYLSAEEIQHLDLSACDLVVLSACETALGSARAGEGLMSLRRSFSVAGADTVISSLWKVDDQATAQLMKDFYTNLWQKGMGGGAALHEAKLRMLRRNRVENGGNALPSTWGAFVLSGKWN